MWESISIELLRTTLLPPYLVHMLLKYWGVINSELPPSSRLWSILFQNKDWLTRWACWLFWGWKCQWDVWHWFWAFPFLHAWVEVESLHNRVSLCTSKLFAHAEMDFWFSLLNSTLLFPPRAFVAVLYRSIVIHTGRPQVMSKIFLETQVTFVWSRYWTLDV